MKNITDDVFKDAVGKKIDKIFATVSFGDNIHSCKIPVDASPLFACIFGFFPRGILSFSWRKSGTQEQRRVYLGRAREAAFAANCQAQRHALALCGELS
jgi:hypothetical protein